MQSSPCRTCDHRHPDYECALKCADRYRYVAGYGDMTHSVPEHMTIYGRTLTRPADPLVPGSGKIQQMSPIRKNPKRQLKHVFTRDKKCANPSCKNMISHGNYCIACNNSLGKRIDRYKDLALVYYPGKLNRVHFNRRHLHIMAANGDFDGEEWYAIGKEHVKQGILRRPKRRGM